MGFKIKPKLNRYIPYALTKGWGVMDLHTGEILKKEDTKHRIERYQHQSWAQKRCNELNKPED